MARWGFKDESEMLSEMQRIAGQQSARFSGTASPSDIDDLRQEGMAKMLEVILSRAQPENVAPYLAGVCKHAMHTWFKTYKAGETVPYDEEAMAWKHADAEGDIDRKRAREKVTAMASGKIEAKA
jgi:DNA-directed RNA polymerase specialized sigma24 family protein